MGGMPKPQGAGMDEWHAQAGCRVPCLHDPAFGVG